MTDEERYKAQSKIIERAIEECLALEDDEEGGGRIPIAWIMLVALRRTETMDQVTHMYIAPEGQAQFASVGLMMSTLDTLRGIANDTQWSDG